MEIIRYYLHVGKGVGESAAYNLVELPFHMVAHKKPFQQGLLLDITGKGGPESTVAYGVVPPDGADMPFHQVLVEAKGNVLFAHSVEQIDRGYLRYR